MVLITCLVLLFSQVFTSGNIWADRVKLSNDEINKVIKCIDEDLHYSHLHWVLSDLSQKHGDSWLDLDVDLSDYKLKKRKKRLRSYGSPPENAGIRPSKSDELKSSGGDRPARRTSSGRTIALRGKSRRNRSKSIDDSAVVNFGSPRKESACNSNPNSPRDDAVTKQIESITSNMASMRDSSTMEPLRESPEYLHRCVGSQDTEKDSPNIQKEREKDQAVILENEGNEVKREKKKDKKKSKSKERKENEKSRKKEKIGKAPKKMYPKEKEIEGTLNNPITTVTEIPNQDTKKKPSPRRGAIKISPRRSDDENSLQTKIETISMASPNRKTSAERFRLLDSARNRKPLEADVPDLPKSRLGGSAGAQKDERSLSRSSSDELIQGIRRNSSLEKAIFKMRRSDETSVSPPKSPLRTSNGETHGNWNWKHMSSSFKISREGSKSSRESDEFEESTDTLMLRAIQKGSIEQLLLLLVNGAEIHPYAIHMICSTTVSSPVEKLKILLDNGAVPYVNAHDQHYYSPLHYLLQRMNMELHYCLPLLEILVNHGVDADMEDKYGIPAMFFFLDRVYKTCSEGNLILRLLLRTVNPYQTFEGGYPILEYCRSPSDLYRPSLKYKLAKRIVEEAKEQYDVVPFRIPEYPYYGGTLRLLE